MLRPAVLVALAVLAAPDRARADTPATVVVTGTVYADEDRDGRFSPGDRPLAGVVVTYESAASATTAADGRYELAVPGAGIVWASAPEGFEPGPAWAPVRTAGPIDLGLRPARASGTLRFVHVSDLHLGNVGAGDVRGALAQATAALDPAPHFVVGTGDLTSGTEAAQFRDLDAALAGLPVPFVPVPGNHDWHDGGGRYRARFGPPMYGFAAGGVRFVVLNFNATAEEQLAHVAAELARHPDAARGPLAVFTHGPPDDAVVARLAELGVTALFTGHMHANRVMRRGRVTEINTEPLAMGGFDYTPAGYRVVERAGDGFTITHHTTVNGEVARMTFPRPGDCIPAGPTPITAAIELGAGDARAAVRIDGGPALPLAPAGGWTYRRDVHVPTGWHTLELEARGTVRESVRFCVVERERARGHAADWAMLGGSAAHAGASARSLAPPLHSRWARGAGGLVLGASPIVVGERVVVPVVDPAAGSAGGLVAFDLRTGAELWAARSGPSVHGTPVSDGTRVVSLADDGVLRAFDVATGKSLWTDDVAAGLDEHQSITTTSPALARGTVVALVQQRIVALDVATGKRLWEKRLGSEANSHSRTAPLVAGGLVVATTGRAKEGLVAYDLRTGAERWRTSKDVSLSLAAAPVAAHGVVYVVNVQSRVTALRLATGAVIWSRRLYGKGEAIDWHTGPLATPALADGRLFVPTPNRLLVALATADGRTLWTREAAPSPLRMLPLVARTHGFLAPPVIARDVLWLPGADGSLAAVDPETGATLWQVDLGAPLVGGPALAGDFLALASYDGTVRVMAHGTGDPRLRVGEGPGARRQATLAALAAGLLVAFLGFRRRSG